MKGRMFVWKKPNGNWIILNSISLSGDTWKNGKKVNCEVWFTSTPISVHWEIPEGDKRWLTCWILVLTTLVCVVVLTSAIFIYQKNKTHLKTRRTQKRRYHTSHASTGHEADDIVYSELKIHSQTQR
ncbi:uncharacterized protein LOC143807959 [Ranitomeya variabilis]|uniref:uncharacterized protein LOC143807959 n=1 Tax=Ranitomeya variabilis TaxID=490064 RepID=UPI004057088F